MKQLPILIWVLIYFTVSNRMRAIGNKINIFFIIDRLFHFKLRNRIN